jgi:hypothetical protein
MAPFRFQASSPCRKWVAAVTFDPLYLVVIWYYQFLLGVKRFLERLI